MRTREHYLQLLDDIAGSLQFLGQFVLDDCTRAVDALVRQDGALAAEIIAVDDSINHARVVLHERVVSVIATQQPNAGDLRRLVSALALAAELERIADYAKRIAKVTVVYAGQPTLPELPSIALLGERALQMLRTSLDGISRIDQLAAEQLRKADDEVDALRNTIRNELIARLRDDPALAEQVVDLCVVIASLERIGDRATNVAEHVIYMACGETVDLNPELRS